MTHLAENADLPARLFDNAVDYRQALEDQYHSLGVYAGQILAGRKPAALSVQTDALLACLRDLGYVEGKKRR